MTKTPEETKATLRNRKDFRVRIQALSKVISQLKDGDHFKYLDLQEELDKAGTPIEDALLSPLCKYFQQELGIRRNVKRGHYIVTRPAPAILVKATPARSSSPVEIAEVPGGYLLQGVGLSDADFETLRSLRHRNDEVLLQRICEQISAPFGTKVTSLGSSLTHVLDKITALTVNSQMSRISL